MIDELARRLGRLDPDVTAGHGRARRLPPRQRHGRRGRPHADHRRLRLGDGHDRRPAGRRRLHAPVLGHHRPAADPPEPGVRGPARVPHRRRGRGPLRERVRGGRSTTSRSTSCSRRSSSRSSVPATAPGCGGRASSCPAGSQPARRVGARPVERTWCSPCPSPTPSASTSPIPASFAARASAGAVRVAARSRPRSPPRRERRAGLLGHHPLRRRARGGQGRRGVLVGADDHDPRRHRHGRRRSTR